MRSFSFDGNVRPSDLRLIASPWGGSLIRTSPRTHVAPASRTHLWPRAGSFACDSAFPDEAEAEAGDLPGTEVDSVAAEAELAEISVAALVVTAAASGGAGAVGVRAHTAFAAPGELQL